MISRKAMWTGVAVLSLSLANAALAAKSSSRSSGGHSYASSSSESSSSSGGPANMMMDLSYHYLRSTSVDGQTDSALRGSVGGMFEEWLGLGVVGIYQVRAQSYLVGADVRLMPTEWFFVKAGAGAYGDKSSRELKATPIAGAGIMARISRGAYVVTETSTFMAFDRTHVSFGAGLGFLF